MFTPIRTLLALALLGVGCAAAPPEQSPPPPVSSVQTTPATAYAPASAPASAPVSAPASASAPAPSAPPPREPPTEEDWARIEPAPLKGAEDRGCSLRILGPRARFSCPLKSPDGTELLEVQGDGELRVSDSAKSMTVRLYKDDEKGISLVWASDARSAKVRVGVPIEVKTDGPLSPALLKQYRRAAECCAKEESAEECAAPFYRIPEHCEKFLSDCKRVNACTRMDFDPRCPAGQINQDGKCRKLCDPKNPKSCNIQNDEICIVTGLSPRGRHVCINQH